MLHILYNCFGNFFVFESVPLFLVFVTQIPLKLIILKSKEMNLMRRFKYLMEDWS